MPSPVKRSAMASRRLGMRMWGYLPASLPQRAPILEPTKVPFNPTANLPNDGWKAVSSGGCGFALAISESGKLFTWGFTDDLGQCYYMAGKHQELPEPFPLQCDPIVFASAGWAHCATVTENGGVYTWGWKECVPTDRTVVEQIDGLDAQGRAEDPNDPSPSNSPESVRKLKHEKARSRMNTARVRAGERLLGTDKTEGVSKRRKLNGEEPGSPDGSAVDESVVAPPCCVPLPAAVKVVTVATGGRHTLALTDSGQVWSWGYGGEGQLGLGSRMRTVTVPQLVPMDVSMKKANADPARPPGSYIIGIACGGRHSAVLTDGGAVLSFGWGLYGQCGQGSTEDELGPHYVSSLGGLHVVAIAAGLWHTLCITGSGEVYAFGGNQFGQLGVGGDQAEMLPKLVEASSLEDECAKSVSCGARHSAICTESGKIYTWGWNKYGQLGLGDNVDRETPQAVSLDCAAISVACGWWHTLALTERI